MKTIKVDFSNAIEVKAWRKEQQQQQTDKLVERCLFGFTLAVCCVYGAAVWYSIQQLSN